MVDPLANNMHVDARVYHAPSVNLPQINGFYQDSMRCLEALKQSYEQKLAQKDAMIKRF